VSLVEPLKDWYTKWKTFLLKIPLAFQTSRFEWQRSTSEVIPFVNEIKNTVELSRTTLPTVSDKAVYLATYLGNGPVLRYSALKLTPPPHLLDDSPLFLHNFHDYFGDPDLKSTCLR
jgi:hypothetical protein